MVQNSQPLSPGRIGRAEKATALGGSSLDRVLQAHRPPARGVKPPRLLLAVFPSQECTMRIFVFAFTVFRDCDRCRKGLENNSRALERSNNHWYVGTYIYTYQITCIAGIKKRTHSLIIFRNVAQTYTFSPHLSCHLQPTF